MPDLGYWGDIIVTLIGAAFALGLIVAIPLAIWKDMNDGER